MKNRLLFILIVAIVILFGVRLIILQAAKPAQPVVPLQINHASSQVVSGSGTSDSKIYHIKYVNGAYENSWTSSPTNSPTLYSASIGDVDNDGLKEITAVVNVKRTTGPLSQRHTAYKKIFVYEDGSTGAPTYISQDLGWTVNQPRDSIIADANNDGANELIFTEEDRIKIYKWSGGGFVHVWTSPIHSDGIWSVDVGDADNDRSSEIVVSQWSGAGSVIVYEYLGNNVWGDSKTTESVGACVVDRVRVRDADSDGLNEIISGGGCGLSVWKFDANSNNYAKVFLQNFGGYTPEADAGDVDGDGKNELITAVSGNIDTVYVFKYSETTKTYEMVDSVPTSGTETFELGDLDNDGKDEMVVGAPGVKIFKYAPNLTEVWSFGNGGFIEVD